MDYKPLLPAVKDNPYPYYARLREHAPVSQVEELGFWAISRYADVDYVLRNPTLFSSSILTKALAGDLDPVPEVPSMIATDPPEHTRLRQEVELSGTTLPAGALVFPLFASANRDGRKFSDPDTFDITRTLDGHLAFGFGIHYCLGAELARLETRIAFEELFAHFPSLTRRDDGVTRADSYFLRGLKTFPLRVEVA